MIKVKQSRKLINGFRTLSINDETHKISTVKDVLRITTDKGDDFYLDIEKDGTISVWSNSAELNVDTKV